MCVTVFKRYELKYLLDAETFKELLKRTAGRLHADEYGKTTVLSLYYDTDDYRIIRRSLESPCYKEKLRLRSYGILNENNSAFLELKKKYRGVVYKRRVKLSLGEVINGTAGSGQIANEIDYFKRFYGNPVPKFLIIYDRIAFVGENGLRVTFDTDIRYRTARLSLNSGLDGTRIIGDDKILAEIKTGTAIPLWLSEILSELKIYKTSFSKCGEAYKAELNKNKTEVKKVG